jgi:hypothetical protein
MRAVGAGRVCPRPSVACTLRDERRALALRYEETGNHADVSVASSSASKLTGGTLVART